MECVSETISSLCACRNCSCTSDGTGDGACGESCDEDCFFVTTAADSVLHELGDAIRATAAFATFDSCWTGVLEVGVIFREAEKTGGEDEGNSVEVVFEPKKAAAPDVDVGVRATADPDTAPQRCRPWSEVLCAKGRVARERWTGIFDAGAEA